MAENGLKYYRTGRWRNELKPSQQARAEEIGKSIAMALFPELART